MVLVGAVGALATGVVGTAMLTRELERQVGETCRARALAISDRVLGTVGVGQGLLETLAEEVGKGPLTPAALDSPLGALLAWNPLFHSIYVYDAAGKVLLRRYASGAESESGRSRGLQDKADVELAEAGLAALADGQGRLLPARRSPAGSLFLPCLAPIRDPAGQVRGLLSGAISASGFGFTTMLQGQAPGRTGFVLLLDRERRLLAAAGPSGLELGEPVPFGAGGEVAGTRLQLPGGPALAWRHAVPELGLEVLVVQPRAEALGALPATMSVMGLATLGALALAALFGLLLGERVAGPVARLTQGIRRVGDGVFSHRVAEEGNDEVAEAAARFNRLAETLERMELVDRAWGATDPQAEAPGESDSPPRPAGP